MLSDKRIVLGVSGGIAAYKSVEISRRLVDAGAFVSPIMTTAAKKFIGEVTLSALASEPVKSFDVGNLTSSTVNLKIFVIIKFF